MTTKSEKLRFIEFLGILGSLLGVIISIGGTDLAFPSEFPLVPLVLLEFVTFVAASFIAYVNVMTQEGEHIQSMRAVVTYFTISLSLLFGLVFMKVVSLGNNYSAETNDFAFIVVAGMFNVIVLYLGIKGIMKIQGTSA